MAARLPGVSGLGEAAERIVDAGRLIGRTSEQNGKKPTSWFLLSQDKWGSVRTMYPVEKPIDPIG
ncbi:hypothetical protein [Streptomyces mexicanus]|uniref:Uncharacterized protein n=1 Tax=Streptomyces mexicanus TaxID=178566 RepID=A0A7X1I0W8_9ACTN|nr:hypothetical protein [Streptomyces mexicanus]MBC2864478.1 hypothetical protein [Streptomyces mexicanus]